MWFNWQSYSKLSGRGRCFQSLPPEAGCFQSTVNRSSNNTANNTIITTSINGIPTICQRVGSVHYTGYLILNSPMRQQFYPHPKTKTPRPEKLSNLPIVAQPESGRVRIPTRWSCLKGQGLHPQTLLPPWLHPGYSFWFQTVS